LVAAAAAAMSAEVQILTFRYISVIYVVLAFSSTWCAYSFLKRNHPLDNIKWKRAAATFFLLNLFLIDKYALMVLFMTALIVLFYSPQMRKESSIPLAFQLRRNPILKTISIATAWVLIVGVIPVIVMSNHYEILIVDLKFILLSFWFLVASLSIAGDLRDAAIDRDKLLTWPSWIGFINTKLLVITMLVVSGFLLILATGNLLPNFLIAIILFTFFASLSIVLVHPKKNWHIQTSWIDGLIILHLVLVYFSLN